MVVWGTIGAQEGSDGAPQVSRNRQQLNTVATGKENGTNFSKCTGTSLSLHGDWEILRLLLTSL